MHNGPPTKLQYKKSGHTHASDNKIADQLANDGTTKAQPSLTPQIHIAHITPYWLHGVPTRAHDGAIKYLDLLLNREN